MAKKVAKLSDGKVVQPTSLKKENILYTLSGQDLTIQVKLGTHTYTSSSGKSQVLASSHGFVGIGGVRINLNVIPSTIVS